MATKRKSTAIAGQTMADWQAEDDMRTLARAAEIRKDPKRLAAAQKLAQQKLLELAQVAGDTDAD